MVEWQWFYWYYNVPLFAIPSLAYTMHMYAYTQPDKVLYALIMLIVLCVLDVGPLANLHAIKI